MSQAEIMTSQLISFTICIFQGIVNLLFASISIFVYILHHQTQLPKKVLNITISVILYYSTIAINPLFHNVEKWPNIL